MSNRGAGEGGEKEKSAGKRPPGRKKPSDGEGAKKKKKRTHPRVVSKKKEKESKRKGGGREGDVPGEILYVNFDLFYFIILKMKAERKRGSLGGGVETASHHSTALKERTFGLFCLLLSVTQEGERRIFR